MRRAGRASRSLAVAFQGAPDFTGPRVLLPRWTAADRASRNRRQPAPASRRDVPRRLRIDLSWVLVRPRRRWPSSSRSRCCGGSGVDAAPRTAELPPLIDGLRRGGLRCAPGHRTRAANPSASAAASTAHPPSSAEAREPRDAIERAWLGLEEGAADSRRPSAPGRDTRGVRIRESSPGCAADRDAARRFLELYLRARFSDAAVTPDDVANARRRSRRCAPRGATGRGAAARRPPPSGSVRVHDPVRERSARPRRRLPARMLRRLILSAVLGVALGVTAWYLGMDAAHAVGLGAAAFAFAACLSALGEAADVTWAVPAPEPRPGARRDLGQLGWSLGARGGRASPEGVRRLRSVAERALSLRGLDLEDRVRRRIDSQGLLGGGDAAASLRRGSGVSTAANRGRRRCTRPGWRRSSPANGPSSSSPPVTDRTRRSPVTADPTAPSTRIRPAPPLAVARRRPARRGRPRDG